MLEDLEKTQNNLLDAFWKLASLDMSEVEAGINQLLSRVEFPSSEILSEEDLSKNCSEDFNYIIGRLVKGLCSSRKGARQGFATALTAILSHGEVSISSDVLVAVIDQHCNPQGGKIKGHEERDFMYGKIFAFAALIKSGNLNSFGSDESIKTVVNALVKFGMNKPYIRELCFSLLYELAYGLKNEEEKKNLILNTIMDHSDIKDQQVEPELSPLLLFFNQDSFNSSLFHDSQESFEKLGNILKFTSSCYPRIHFCWNHVLRYAVNKQEYFEKLWKSVVEDLFLSGEKSSVERKFLGVSLVELIIESFSSNSKVTSFVLSSRETIFCILSNCSNPKYSLHQKAKSAFLDKIAPFLVSHSDVLESFKQVLPLMMKVDLGSFENLLSSSDYSKIFGNQVNESETIDLLLLKLSEERRESQAKNITEKIITSLKSMDGSKKESISLKALRVLIDNSFYDSDFKMDLCSYFWSIIKCCITSSKDEYLKSIYKLFKQFDKDKKPLRVEYDEEIERIIIDSEKLIKKSSFAAVNNIILFLLIQIKITKTDEDFVGEVAGNLEELNQVLKSILAKEVKDLNPYSVLMDMCLSLLSNEKLEIIMKLVKILVEDVVKCIVPCLDETGVIILCKAINPYLVDNDDVEMESEEEDNEENENVESDASADEKPPSEAFLNAVKKLNDDEMEEVDEERDLNDEEMVSLGFDSKLAEIFKLQKIEKKEKKIKKKNLVDFKYRTIELSSVFLKECENGTFFHSVGMSLLESIVLHSTALKGNGSVAKNVNYLSSSERNGITNKMTAIFKTRVLKKKNLMEDSQKTKENIQKCLYILFGNEKILEDQSMTKYLNFGVEKNVSKLIINYIVQLVGLLDKEEKVSNKLILALFDKMFSLSNKKRTYCVDLIVELIKRRFYLDTESFSELLKKGFQSCDKNTKKLQSLLNISKAFSSSHNESVVIESAIETLDESILNKTNRETLKGLKKKSLKRKNTDLN